jgi:hypothetical protein
VRRSPLRRTYLKEVGMSKVAKMKAAQCPKCLAKGEIREILYGMPRQPVDESRYELGGCLVTEHDPKYLCKLCNL